MRKDIELFDFQVNDVHSIRQGYKNKCRAILYVLPTGGGKTFVFTFIASKVKLKNKKVIILTHRKELLRQASKSLDFLEVEHGLISPGHSTSFESVQVASVHTLKNRLDRTQEPDLIVIDEAHHSVKGNTWGKVIERWPRARLLGVTATPLRLDGNGLGKDSDGFFDYMVQGPTMKELMRLKRLAPYELYAPKSKELDLDGVDIINGEFSQKQLQARMDKPRITGDAVEHYSKICPGTPAIVFCCSVKHAYNVCEEFIKGGYKAKCIESNMSDYERDMAIRDLGNGVLDILTSCDIISEGTDIPIVGCGILLRPTESLGLYLQQVGRILRYQFGKIAYILDCVGNWERHGLPDADREWQLNPPKKRKKKLNADDIVLVAECLQCLNCFMVYGRGMKTCPHCGHARGVLAREVEKVEGELERISAEVLAKSRRRNEQQKAETIEDLLKIARDRGYKPSWAHQIYKSRLKKRKLKHGN